MARLPDIRECVCVGSSVAKHVFPMEIWQASDTMMVTFKMVKSSLMFSLSLIIY